MRYPFNNVKIKEYNIIKKKINKKKNKMVCLCGVFGLLFYFTFNISEVSLFEI